MLYFICCKGLARIDSVLSQDRSKDSSFSFSFSKSQAAQARDVNKLFNSDTVTQRTIYRDCMGNLPLC